MEMNHRKKQILMAIIHDYVDTAEPVGSRTIARKYNLGVSPATIRNEMADLEESGYIKQPYTSAGRIPSERGYRYYVDYLMKVEELSEQEIKLIQREYKTKVREIAEVIQVTGRLLSQLTNYTAMVMAPQLGVSAFKHIQLVLLRPTQAMVVVVMDNGAVQYWIINIPENITQEDLEKISQVINAKFNGLTVKKIRQNLLREVYTELARYRQVVDMALELINENLSREKEDRVYLGGVFNILNQPEFHNIEKLKTLLSILEQEDLLCNLLAHDKQVEGVTVRIGKEIQYDEINECSMVTAIYKIGKKPIGSIGILGPTRMKYERVVSVVEYTTKYLSRVLEDMYRGNI